MDVLAHALYGATCFSRSGLAGVRRRPARNEPVLGDWSIWAAACFGIFPDVSSIGVAFAQMLWRGEAVSFHGLPPYLYVLYHATHSLLTAGLVLGVLGVVARPLVLPALAWPLHVVMDLFTHGNGVWQTLVFYPLSDWHITGLNWWQHPRVIMAYWAALPALWCVVFWLKRRQ